MHHTSRSKEMSLMIVVRLESSVSQLENEVKNVENGASHLEIRRLFVSCTSNMEPHILRCDTDLRNGFSRVADPAHTCDVRRKLLRGGSLRRRRVLRPAGHPAGRAAGRLRIILEKH